MELSTLANSRTMAGFRSSRAEAAVTGGNAQRQQAAVAQGIALGLRRAAALVAFDGGQGKFGGQLTGGLQRGRAGALWFGGHTKSPVLQRSS
jgi:hypothetical protein